MKSSQRAEMTGEELRAARQAIGATQEAMAREVGVTLGTLGNWERGRPIPRIAEPALKAALKRLGATEKAEKG